MWEGEGRAVRASAINRPISGKVLLLHSLLRCLQPLARAHPVPLSPPGCWPTPHTTHLQPHPHTGLPDAPRGQLVRGQAHRNLLLQLRRAHGWVSAAFLTVASQLPPPGTLRARLQRARGAPCAPLPRAGGQEAFFWSHFCPLASARCHSTGHVFEGEGFPTPTDARHCVNSVSVNFKKA